MSFVNFPEDILLLVLKRIPALQGTCIESWKQQLRLLAVNSCWRKHMLSTVYSKLLVLYSKQEKPTATNIELIANHGHTSMVKKLVIEISITNHAVNLLPAVQLLQRHASVWPFIKTLSISYLNNVSIFSYREVWQDSLWVQNKKVVDILVKALPNIVFLQLNGYRHNAILDAYKMIAKSYSKQISKLICNHPLVVASQQHYLERLEHAKFNFDLREIEYPLDISVKLKSLELYDLPAMFSWMCFANKKTKTVVFSKLKVLKLHSYDKLKSNIENFELLDDNYKIYFPQLMFLEIVPQAEQYPLLNLGVFDNVLDHIYIHGALDALETICIPNMPQAKHISINAAISFCRYMSKVIKLLNELASTAIAVSCVKLTVYDKAILLNPVNIDGSILTHLYLKAPINAYCTLNVLQAFPNLEELEISQVFYDSSMDEVLNSDVASTDPLHTKLNSLIYNYHLRKKDNSQFAVEFLQYLQLRLPQLLRVVTKHNLLEQTSQVH